MSVVARLKHILTAAAWRPIRRASLAQFRYTALQSGERLGNRESKTETIARRITSCARTITPREALQQPLTLMFRDAGPSSSLSMRECEASI